jgi:hypothetical protein
MTDKDILLEDIDTAWSAISQQYVNSPDESMRNALNLLAGIKREIEQRMKEREKEKERISVQEWLDWLQTA